MRPLEPIELTIARQWYMPFEPLFCRAIPLLFRDQFFLELVKTIGELADDGSNVPATVDGVQFAKIVNAIDPTLKTRFVILQESDARKRAQMQPDSQARDLVLAPSQYQRLHGEFMQEILR